MTVLDLTDDRPLAEAPPEVVTTLADAVADAARVLGPGRPIRSFVAMDPMGRLHDRDQRDAADLVAWATGHDPRPGEHDLRMLHRAGRISTDHLRRALRRRGLDSTSSTTSTTGRVDGIDPLEVLVADLLDGAPGTAPHRPPVLAVERLDAAAGTARTAIVDRITARWAAAYVAAAERGDGWAPTATGGVWDVGRRLAAGDRELRRWAGRPAGQQVRVAPVDPLAALAHALDRLAVAPADQTPYLRAHLGRLPGWSAHLAWRAEQGGPDDLTGWLALRCWTELALLDGDDLPPDHLPALPADRSAPAEPPPAVDPSRRTERVLEVLGRPGRDHAEVAAALARLPVDDRGKVWQEALELAVADEVLAALHAPAGPGTTGDRPVADVVTCIDVRAEPLRRQLPLDVVRSHGFAGFFGLAMTWHPATGAPVASCPVPVAPSAHIREVPIDPGAARLAARHAALAHAHDAEQRAARAPASPYLLAEVAGWGALVANAARTLAPGATARAVARARHRVVPAAPTRPVVDAPTTRDGAGLDLAARVAWAEATLRSLGLAGRTGGAAAGRLLVLVGHGATSANNPLAAGLACGACGGQPGGPNARVGAHILNDPAVRRALDDRGVGLPADTVAVAAEHDTTTDVVTILDPACVPASHAAELAEIAAVLDRAASAVAAERCRHLPGAPADAATDPRRARRHVHTRAHDWAQVVPEWGLAGNAALIVAPADAIAGRDLGGRAFLCDHHPDLDPDGSLLAGIFGGPLVVAQGINAHYAAAAADPHRTGSGSKVLHNVIAGVGVIEGASGDLRQALPVQSVRQGDRLVHEPVRLLVAVQTTPERVDAALAGVDAARHLVDGSWVRLVARPTSDSPWSERIPGGGWRPWNSNDLPTTREEPPCWPTSTS